MHQTHVVTAGQYSNDLRRVIEQPGDLRFADTLRRWVHVTATALNCAEISGQRARFQPKLSGVLPRYRSTTGSSRFDLTGDDLHDPRRLVEI